MRTLQPRFPNPGASEPAAEPGKQRLRSGREMPACKHRYCKDTNQNSGSGSGSGWNHQRKKQLWQEDKAAATKSAPGRARKTM